MSLCKTKPFIIFGALYVVAGVISSDASGGEGCSNRKVPSYGGEGFG